MRRAIRAASVAAVTFCAVAAQAQPARLVIESGPLHPGRQEFGVRLETTVAVADTVNELSFDGPAPIAFDVNRRPLCRVNDAIGKSDSTLALLPPDCVAGIDCTGLRAEIADFEHRDPIESGAVLYRCSAPLGLPPGVYAVRCRAAEAAAPNRRAVAVECDDTELIVEAGALLRPTSLYSLEPGSTGLLGVALQANVEVDALSFDLLPDAVMPVAADIAGRPHCGLNGELSLTGHFTFLPSGCHPNADCVGVHVDLEGDGTALPSGNQQLFACVLSVDADAPAGFYPLTLDNRSGVASDGATLPVESINLAIEVGPLEEPPPTPPRTTSSGGGCQVGEPAVEGVGWLLLAWLLIRAGTAGVPPARRNGSNSDGGF
jgi:hypothetical protein